MHLYTVSEWLDWIASLHTEEIDLGLDRVKRVAGRLKLLPPSSSAVIIVGGTNGKGSTVAGLEAIYRASGYRVGAFTSPVLFKHNEQVRINGEMCSDALFCQAFAKIAAVCGDVALTPFEYHTLAALLILQNFSLDVWILEVGLGGRLDAVNIIDADVAIVTSIDLDHMDWLGDTREKIAIEKAGIFRSHKPAICGDFNPPTTLVECAEKINAPLYCQGKEFSYKKNLTTWSWHFQNIEYNDLPLCALALQNMSSVLMGVHLLQAKLPVMREAIDTGLANVKLAGRVQVLEGEVVKIFDVSHNPASIAYLATRLDDIPCRGNTVAVFSMLADKDIFESIKSIQNKIDMWFVAPLSSKRAASAEKLKHAFQSAHIQQINFFTSIKEAFHQAEKIARNGDRIILFGSFHTVSEVLLNLHS